MRSTENLSILGAGQRAERTGLEPAASGVTVQSDRRAVSISVESGERFRRIARRELGLVGHSSTRNDDGLLHIYYRRAVRKQTNRSERVRSGARGRDHRVHMTLRRPEEELLSDLDAHDALIAVRAR
jgi:hypothetical protein